MSLIRPINAGGSAALLAALAVLACGASTAARGDSNWLYGIHWYGDAADSRVETMTGGKGIWSLEIVETNSDEWWSAAWQREQRFLPMLARGHSLIVRIERNWGETVPYPGNLADYLPRVQAAAVTLADVCHIWQIGNEMNLYAEWGGMELTPAAYVEMYRAIRAAIQSVFSPLGPQIVLLGPVSPGDVIAGIRHTAGNDYLAQMCGLLAPGEVDGFALHAYAAPWYDAPTARAEFYSAYVAQLAVLDTYGFADKPVYSTEWNRRVDPINDENEAASAQFLSGALADLHAWNQTAGAHPIACACWFIYAYDSGAWANYSIEYLNGVGPPGPENDLFDALQQACTLDLPAAWPPAGATPRLSAGVPQGNNVAPQATGASVSSGSGAWLAIDGVVSVESKWTSEPSVPPHWLQLDLGRLRRVSGYVVRHAGAAGEPAHFNTEAFAIQTGAAADGPWEVEGLVYNGSAGAGQPAGAGETELCYTEERAVRHVRLLIVDPGIDNYARVPEFEVYAVGTVGDYDGDDAVDGDDLPAIAFCLAGPECAYAAGHFCLAGDAEQDGDVDLSDFAQIQVEAGW